MSLHRPETLDDALSLMGGGAAVALGGGTDLYPALRDGVPPSEMVDLTRVAGLRGISRDGSGWRIGAATSWTQVARAELPPLFDGLRAAAREVGSVQIQNAGTVAGNLCNASPAADGVPPLLVLNSLVEAISLSGIRRIPLAEFILENRKIALNNDELVTRVLVPRAASKGCSAFLKLGSRKYLVISISMVAVRLETDDQGHIIEATQKKFDDFAGSEINEDRLKRILGLK